MNSEVTVFHLKLFRAIKISRLLQRIAERSHYTPLEIKLAEKNGVLTNAK